MWYWGVWRLEWLPKPCLFLHCELWFLILPLFSSSLHSAVMIYDQFVREVLSGRDR